MVRKPKGEYGLQARDKQQEVDFSLVPCPMVVLGGSESMAVMGNLVGNSANNSPLILEDCSHTVMKHFSRLASTYSITDVVPMTTTTTTCQVISDAPPGTSYGMT